MDTKLRSFSRSSLTKFLAFLLVVAMTTAMGAILIYTYFSGINPEVLLTKDYKNSEAFSNSLSYTLWNIEGLLSGEEIEIDDGIVFFGTNEERTISHPFHITETIIKNTGSEYYILKDGYLVSNEQGNDMMVSRYSGNPSNKVIFAFSQKYLEEKQEQWDLGRDRMIPLAAMFFGSLAGIIFLVSYLIIVTGKKAGDEHIHLAPIDKLFTEIILAAAIITIGSLALISGAQLRYFDYPEVWKTGFDLTSMQSLAIFTISAAIAFTTGALGVVILSSARRIKKGMFIKSSLTYKIWDKAVGFLRSFFDGSRMESFPLTRKLHKRQMIFVGASFIIVLLSFPFLSMPPIFIMLVILEFVLVYWYFKFNKETFEEINKGFDDSLEGKMKAERMKVNLITNVSHDLKTPLTSIISYVDLLKREDGLSDQAKEYVGILSDKSNRLKSIVSDLFELAKSTSGDIKLELKEIDIRKLIQQTLGEMSDIIETSGIQVRTELPEEAVIITSDGNKLYRVLQNIIDNALKYSLKGTRVYVKLENNGTDAKVTVINTSAYEMSFTEEEILQRFYRGDEARSGEGSGLGLSIAESFTRNLGGRLKVVIDGDQFKVIMEFPL